LLGKVFLHDTTDGSDTFVAMTTLNTIGLSFTSSGMFLLNIGPSWSSPQRVYSIDTLEYVELPPNRSFAGQAGDDRWLISRWWAGGPHELFDPGTGEVTPLFAGDGTLLQRNDDGLEILDVKPCCLEEDTLTDQGAIYFVPFDGSPARRLVEEATRFNRRLQDGRLAGMLDLDDELLGRLVLLDPDTHSTRLIDDRVFAYGLTGVPAHGENTMVYSVDDGARSGVWLARLTGE
jgi:hypothetical protein